MFGGPGNALAKARRLLAQGDPLAALRLARKAGPRARPPLAGEIAAFAEEARRAVVAEAEARAEASAAEGFFADAAEWLRGGLDHAEGDGERGRLAARLAELEDLAADAAERPGPVAVPDAEDRDAGDREAADLEAEPAPGETLYDAFVESLRDEVAEHYRDRPPEFRRAVVDLGEWLAPDASRAAIEALAEADPDDPVLRLERGRWRLARGDAAGAVADLEAAWAAFGDDPLDHGGALSVPEMWCEAALAAGDHAAVLERLEARGELTLGDPDLSLFYARALLAAGEDAEARRFLAESVGHFPRRVDLALLLAGSLAGAGRALDAVEALEGSLRACGAGCAASEHYPPALRLLAGLYAEAGGPVERLGDVLSLLRGARGGDLEPGDWMLEARYHELAGDPAAARRARERAGALLQASGDEGGEPPPAYEAD